MDDHWDTIVVGAGFSGLAAARQLRATGLRVLVLEAAGRVGGRALSDYRLADGTALELGAQMVHGRHVITHAWVQAAGLHTTPLSLHQRSRLVIHRRFGRYPWFALPFHPVIGTRATWDGFRRIPRELAEYSGPDRSLRAFLDERSVRPAARAIVDVFHSHSYSADPDQLGTIGPAEEERRSTEPFGFRNFRLTEGYSALVQHVASSFRDAIRTGVTVTRVTHGPDGVRVTARGPEPSTETDLAAEAVIVTVPLGVLQADAIRFDPPLPPAKRAAIGRIGFGNVFALHVRLHGSTIRRRLGDFGVLWGDTATSFRRYRESRPGGDEILTAFTTGREAARRAALDDEGIVAATRAEWEAVAPEGAEWGTVVGSVVHRWPTDPWVRGGYSFLPVGGRLADRAQLAAPMGDRVFFAGEASDLDGGAATVPGAIRTGERAAREVVEARRRRAR